MSSEIRQQRVRGLLFEELTIMLGGELGDPRLDLVTVTDVVVSKDLKNVRVYVSHQDEAVSKREVLSRLVKAVPFIRSQLGLRLGLRVVPELSFTYDDSPERAQRLTELLAQIKAENAAAAAADNGANGEQPA